MRHWLVVTIFSIVISLIFLLAYHCFFVDKIGYVRSGEILTKYKGMVATNEQFQKEMSLVEANIDTLKSRYLELKNQADIKNDKDISYRMGVAENEFMSYQNSASQQMEIRRQALAKSVLDRINTFIQEYGDKNGYDYIFGSTNEGSLLKGKASGDLTESILKELNADYDKSAGIPNAKDTTGTNEN